MTPTERSAGAIVALMALLSLLGSTPARAQDPCLQCDIMYASDCGRALWAIDLTTRTSTFIGNTSNTLYDIAVTWDGRLIGMASGGALFEVSACDATSVPLPMRTSGNGLTGDLNSTYLFSQGPPLVAIDGQGVFPRVTVGGAIGAAPPDWCGGSSGDLALNPDDDFLTSTLRCNSCPGDALVTLDPLTGDMVNEIGCVRNAAGTVDYGALYGLAYDSSGTLWAGRGQSSPTLLQVDRFTAVATEVPISGGYDCAFGLATVPCSRPFRPCSFPDPPAADVGDVLLVSKPLGFPGLAIADLDWSSDQGAPRPMSDHHHVYRGTVASYLSMVPDIEPLRATYWRDVTTLTPATRRVHFYRVLAADECEYESEN